MLFIRLPAKELCARTTNLAMEHITTVSDSYLQDFEVRFLIIGFLLFLMASKKDTPSVVMNRSRKIQIQSHTKKV